MRTARARTAVRRVALVGGVAGLAAAVLTAGLPFNEESYASLETDRRNGVGLEDISGLTPEELIARDLTDLSDAWADDHDEPEPAEPATVREVRDRTPTELVQEESQPESPRAGRPVKWPSNGPDRFGLVEVSTDSVQVDVALLGRGDVAELGGAIGVILQPEDSSLAFAANDGLPAEVTVDYTGFEHAFGGDYGSRLRAVAYDPDCFTDEQDLDCAGDQLESLNDPAAGTITTLVDLTARGVVVVLTAGESGPAGDWSATSLSPSGEWSHGGSSGDFLWSYPLRTPDMPGGLSPDLSLGYSAQSVDGRTTSTNNQTSWIGEGWSGLEPGFVERRYVACAEDMAGSANNAMKTGDLCWKEDHAVLSIGGSTSVLVKDRASGVWRPKNDDGSRVERLTGAVNGARNGEHWRVTTVDGTQFYFGKHTRYEGDTARTKSVLTVPVAGNHPGEPCHASAFKDSFCDQAYRWMLDYVVDTNGNTMTYFYTRESNRYGQNLNERSVSYHRGAFLERVEYGQRQGSEHSTAAPARVVFTTSERCLVDCDTLGEGTAENWPDVPYDLICTSSSSCASQVSPSFFSRKRLTQVQTQVWVAGSHQEVDRWTLTHDFPDPGDGNAAALWLSGVTHSGRAGSPVTLPTVVFDGVQMPNRVDGLDDAPPLNRYRIRWIRSETGAYTQVQYSGTDCTPSDVPTAHTNARLCFPVHWNFEGSQDPKVHWFHKYVVDALVQTDGTGGGVDVEYYYTYHGEPAWAYNDDPFIKSEFRTWSQWRGYQRITTRVGNPAARQLRTERLYLQGMHGDRSSPAGGTKSVTVTDSWDDSVIDHEYWAGMLREEVTYDGSSIVTSTVHDPWRSALTADDGTVQARFADVGATRVHTKLSSGWRTTEVQYSHDSHGLVTEVNDRGDISTTKDDLCTRTNYVKNTSKWIVDAVKRIETVSKRCSATPTRPADVVSEERFSYDGGSYGSAPTKGNLSRTQVLDTWEGSAAYVTTSELTHDMHGRVTSITDALGRTTTTAYTPATGGPATQTVVTNPAGHTTSTLLDARLGVPTRVTDANGKRTDAEYDAMGRLTSVWLTDRDRGKNETASMEFAYRVANDKPVTVTAKSLLPSGEYAAKVDLYDSLLRPRQTQAPAAGTHGGRLLTLSEYDSRGLVVEATGPFFATGSPSTVLLEPTDSVGRQILTSFDGAGRAVSERLVVHHDEHSRRTMSYGGDRIRMTPPDGGTATTTIMDARGNIVELRHHRGGTPSGAYDAMTYTWTADGQLATATDAAGNTWSYEYDFRGRRVVVDDPDAGTSTMSYDAAGQVTESTDGRGQAASHAYDPLGRMISLEDGDGTVLAEWVYDTLAKGQLTSATSYVDGHAYSSVVYGYDDGYRPLGQTISIPAVEGALAGEYTAYRTYHVDGSVEYEWRPQVAGLSGETALYVYNASGAPARLGGHRAYVVNTHYSPFGDVEQYVLDALAGFSQQFSYEEGTGRLSRVRVHREGADPADVDVRYSYDQAGNPLQVADTGREAGAGDVQCFTYDHLRRITGAWSQTDATCASGPESAAVGGPAPYAQSYTYDQAGNRKTLVDHATNTTTAYGYPATGQGGPHTLTSVITGEATTSYSYDAAGNTVSVSGPDGDVTYDWDPRGRMVAADTGEGVSEFVYGADGERLLRKTPQATTLYVHNTEITVTATGEVSAHRYYGINGATLAMLESPDGNPNTVQLHRIGSDLWGTPTSVIQNGSMNFTARRMDPFGNPRGQALPNWPTDRGFHTGTHDEVTALVQMGARYYQPSIGRFLSVDPLIDHLDPDQIHGYAYANNNPLAYSDPSGLFVCAPDGINLCADQPAKQQPTIKRPSRGNEEKFAWKDGIPTGPSSHPPHRPGASRMAIPPPTKALPDGSAVFDGYVLPGAPAAPLYLDAYRQARYELGVRTGHDDYQNVLIWAAHACDLLASERVRCSFDFKYALQMALDATYPEYQSAAGCALSMAYAVGSGCYTVGICIGGSATASALESASVNGCYAVDRNGAAYVGEVANGLAVPRNSASIDVRFHTWEGTMADMQGCSAVVDVQGDFRYASVGATYDMAQGKVTGMSFGLGSGGGGSAFVGGTCTGVIRTWPSW